MFNYQLRPPIATNPEQTPRFSNSYDVSLNLNLRVTETMTDGSVHTQCYTELNKGEIKCESVKNWETERLCRTLVK